MDGRRICRLSIYLAAYFTYLLTSLLAGLKDGRNHYLAVWLAGLEAMMMCFSLARCVRPGLCGSKTNDWRSIYLGCLANLHVCLGRCVEGGIGRDIWMDGQMDPGGRGEF